MFLDDFYIVFRATRCRHQAYLGMVVHDLTVKVIS